MTIEYVNMDITTVRKGVVAHGVNCSGYAMNSGVAKAIRAKWPKVYTEYVDFCKPYTKKELLGLVNRVHIDWSFHSPLIVVNCFTQMYFGKDGKKYADVDAIESSLNDCIYFCHRQKMNIDLLFQKEEVLPFYMPKIGCGLGGLDWDSEVKPIVEQLSLKFPDVNIFVCEWK